MLEKYQASSLMVYLFYTAEARAAFVANPAPVIASASARWGAVRSELVQ